MGPPAPPPPSPEQQLIIRRKAAEDILSLIPPPIARTFFATNNHDEMARQVEEDILMCFGDAYMNRHWIYQILDLVVVKLLPEMVGKTPRELLADRGVDEEDEEEETKAEDVAGDPTIVATVGRAKREKTAPDGNGTKANTAAEKRKGSKA